MIIVFDDAPEQNKELKERGTSDVQRLCLRAVGEPTVSSSRTNTPSFLTTFVDFLVLFSPKAMLSDALVRTVSTQSKSVDGQRCGHRLISTQEILTELNRIYPVLNVFLCR